MYNGFNCDNGTEKSETKSAKELQRESITVTSNAEAEPEKVVETKEAVTETEEVVEQTTEEVAEAIEETEEELEAAEKEKEAATTDKERQKAQKRIDRLTAKNKEYEAELAALKRENEELKSTTDKKLTEEDVNKAADIKAAQKAFDNMCNKMFDDAEKLNKNFAKLVEENTKLIGPIPAPLIHMMDDLENGGAILNHLMENEDEAEEIYKLSMAKAATRLAKISETLKAKAVKKVSKAPPPIDPIKGSTEKGINLNAPNMSDAEWVEARKKDVAQKRQSGQRPNLY